MKAALIIIGNEILSGRTKDKNLAYLAEWLNEIGIQLYEVRVIRDDEKEIIDCVNLLRKKFDYVFTTGGIGPTHDDITTESIAKAFDVELETNPEALKILQGYYKKGDLNEARLKMTLLPKGAELVENPVTVRLATQFSWGSRYCPPFVHSNDSVSSVVATMAKLGK